MEKAREVLKDEVIAIIGYGVQGPGQSLNLKDNGFKVIVGQRKGKTFDKAVADGWVPGVDLFEIEEACEKGTIIQFLAPGITESMERIFNAAGQKYWYMDKLNTICCGRPGTSLPPITLRRATIVAM